jgi:hypothetical protein
MSQSIDMDAVIAELRKGWCKGSEGVNNALDPTAEVCLLGAVARVLQLDDPQTVYGLASDFPFGRIVMEHFSDRLPTAPPKLKWWTVTDFNDNRATTVDDVILVVEKARARQGEVL